MRRPRNILLSLVLSSIFILGATPATICAVAAESGRTIKLPPPRMDRPATLMTSLKNRRSSRTFSGVDLSRETISDLLWAACGVNRPDGRRTAPSAKNWQEIDVYVAMESGLYLYNAGENSLDLVKKEDLRALCGKQGFTQDAPVNLIYVADQSRMSRDTPENLFSAAADTGFISQNVYLYCAAEGLSTVVLGWVDAPSLAKAMGLEDAQRVILTQPVGYPAGDQ
jgi:SagB-type dehydrogenase family enzyme